jgi:hydrogenase maturation factor
MMFRQPQPSAGIAVAAAVTEVWRHHSRRGDPVSGLVDIAIPANAQAAAEALGLKVDRSITNGTWVRQLPREEAEIAVECLRDYGVAARIVDSASRDEGRPERDTTRAA